MLTGWLAMLMLAAQGPAPAPAPQTLPDWLAGSWEQEKDGEWWEEYWTPARAGIMFGASRSGKAGNLSFWEQMRIESGADGLSFCASPRGQAGGCFKAVSVTATEVAFENRAHDYPVRVVYRRDGADLLAEISGPNGSQLEKWRFKRTN